MSISARQPASSTMPGIRTMKWSTRWAIVPAARAAPASAASNWKVSRALPRRAGRADRDLARVYGSSLPPSPPPYIPLAKRWKERCRGLCHPSFVQVRPATIKIAVFLIRNDVVFAFDQTLSDIEEGNEHMRRTLPGALLAMAILMGIVAVTPAAAAVGVLEAQQQEAEQQQSGTLVTEPIKTDASGAAIMPSAANAPASPAATCYEGQECAWAGYFGGTFSFWPGYDTGCHNHASNPTLTSGSNFTPYRLRVGGYGYVQPHNNWYSSGGPVYGELCWPA